MTFRILVTGSRNWPSFGAIDYALSWYDESHDLHGITLVHGGALGADVMADRVAKRLGWEIESHPVTSEDWQTKGKQAGFLRNYEMVKLGADVCLAFIHNQSKGATMCADLAEKNGIPTYRYLSGK